MRTRTTADAPQPLSPKEQPPAPPLTPPPPPDSKPAAPADESERFVYSSPDEVEWIGKGDPP